MNAELLFVNILDNTLVPFDKKYMYMYMPDHHRLFQDNDSKHSFRCTKTFFEEKGINWWKKPAESPDANIIENL